MTKHNIWSISIIGFLFALLFTPLIVSESMYFPYVTGKVFTFRIIISIILILWTILVLKKPEYLPKKSGIIIASGLFVFFLAISNFLGVDKNNSFFSNFERMEGWFTHLYLFVYLVIVSSVFKTEKIWNWFFGTSLVVANILALYATFDDVGRTSVFLGNSTYVAIYALFNLFFAVLLFVRLYKVKVEVVALKYIGLLYYVSSILLLAYVIFRTQTRGTMLALIFSVVAFLILSAISYRKNKKVQIVTLTLFVLSLIVAGLFWTNRDSSFVQNNPSLLRIATISPGEGTAKARLVNWGIALDGIKENPVFGWGQENYVYVFAKYYDPEMYKEEPWFDRTHNSFIDWAVQGGLVAFLLYVSLFVLGAWTIHKSTSLTRIEKNILITALGGYIIHNLFVFDNYSSYLMFFTLLGFIVHHSQKETLVMECDEKMKQVAAIVLIIGTFVTGYIVIVKPFQVAKGLITVLTYKDAYKILEDYEKIFAKNTFGNFEATSRLLSDSSTFTQVQNPEFVKTYLDFAFRAGDQMIKDNPGNVRALEFVGAFMLQQGQLPRAIEVLEQARVYAPNRHNNLYTLGYAYINNKEFDKAKEVFEHAYNLKPDVVKARTYYGGVLLLMGDKKGSELIQGYNPNDSFFLSVFNKTKQYKEAIKIQEEQIKNQPENYQLQVSLAITYLFDGQRTKSIELIREVIKKVPEFKGQGEFLIKEIQAGRNPAL
jgi:O-antigen ligase/tetratricopeptide (TPR) repeat protein